MRYSFPGYFLALDQPSRFKHHIGGSHSYTGANCPNCKLPLFLHARIDFCDPRITLASFGLKTLPLLYCTRCALCWDDFSYQILNDHEVQICQQNLGEVDWEGWEEIVGVNCFPQRAFELMALPSRVQELYDRLNSDKSISDNDKAYIASVTGHYASPDVGGYPMLEPVNQIGGRSFLIQQLDDPHCYACELLGKRNRMSFLASFVNDSRHNLQFTFEDTQIAFFFCSECGGITAKCSVS